jgi:2-amino-4-hydroxy-6-hydroxymethyldihydropteridine diphosphokinase
MASEELTLPHPAMAQRRFVLEPLAEIAGEMAEPVSGKVGEMLAGIIRASALGEGRDTDLR